MPRSTTGPVQGDAEVGQRPALAVPVAGLPVDGGSVLVGCDGVVDLPQLNQGAPEDVQYHGFAVPVAGVAVDRRGGPDDGDCLVEPAHPEQGSAEIAKRRGFAMQVVGVAEDGSSAPGGMCSAAHRGRAAARPVPGPAAAPLHVLPAESERLTTGPVARV